MRKVALVLGGADCLHEDREAACALFTPDTVVATNHAGKVEPGPVPHWCSMHPELFPLWLTERRANGMEEPLNLWCPLGRPAPKHLDIRRVRAWGGSSGMLAVLVAFELGYDRVVLAGVPLNTSPHFDDPKVWRDGPRFHYSWKQHRDQIADTVRSMSGWTREFLGAPDAGWLA